jgi:exodeoxyribonuclease-5
VTEQFASWDPSEDQARTLDGVLKWYRSPHDRETRPLETIGGYAGTGKTALAGHVAKILSEGDGLKIAFATYTGKASLVLEKSLSKAGLDFSIHYIGTIHRLLYRPLVDPMNGRVTGWERTDAIPYDLIIIDEASMVPTKIVKDLLEYGIPILAIGDHGQLPPVGEDAGLMKSPRHRLEVIHRQAKGNPIIELSTLVRQGYPLDTIIDYIKSHKEDERLQHRTGAGGIQEALDFASPPGMLITFTNYLRTSVNNKARRWNGFQGAPQVDETVICVKNAYLDDGLLANGTRGIIKAIAESDKHRFQVTLDTGDKEPIQVLVSKHQFGHPQTFKGFDEIPGQHYTWDDVGVLMDYGYALTRHKAQGSQAEHVAVLVERSLWRLTQEEWTRWTYTAITRSSDKLMFITGV